MKRKLKIFTEIWLSIIMLSIPNLPPISCISNEPYNRCGTPFNCGKLTGIGFPFWGGNRPAECGYAALRLGCENGTTATIAINGANYRVLDFNEETKTLKIARNDLLQTLCPPQLVNTTLDPRLLEYASSYVNLTFLYGCPTVDFPVPFQFECAVKGVKEKVGYVEFGSQMSGMCHASVVVPVSYASFFNFKDLEALIGEGFEVRLTVDSGDCAGCERSGGKCGYNDAGKDFVCFCADQSAAASKHCGGGAAVYADAPRPPTVSDVGKQGPQAATVVAPSVAATSREEFYQTCGNTFSCGNTIAEIGYPFRGNTDPVYCGHPSLVLTCDDRNNATTIDIMNTTYRVLDIFQATQTMRIVREDLMEGPCPQEMANTTLDYSLFDYASSYTNFTFLYGCPASNLPGLNLISCGSSGYSSVYVFPGTQGPGSCNASVIVPVLLGVNGGGGSSVNTTSMTEILQQGFEVRWKIGGKSCSDCTESKGRCGYNIESNQTTCFCPDPPYVSDTCSMASGASPGSGNGLSDLHKYVIIGVSLLVISFIIIFCITKQYRLRYGDQESNQNVEKLLLTYGSLAPKRYSYNEIKNMTKSFKDKLGQGGYGIVYKGELPDSQLVAVKVLTDTHENMEDFINEVASISRTSHVNIVNLLGFSYQRKKRALVYEFMPNKSLDKFIYKRGSTDATCLLEMDKLYEIALGVARGLEYLHRGCNTRIVHFDIKPQNILLDQDFCPKISDFGLAKLYKQKQSKLSTFGARGTIGYIAPEVFSRNFGVVSHKSDVYSYGMMLIEMAESRKVVEIEPIQSSENYFPVKIYEQVLLKTKNWDDVLTDEKEEIEIKMLMVGLWCIQTAPSDRPSMSKVVEMLEGSLQFIQIPPKPFFSSLEPLQFSSSIDTDIENST